MKKILKFLMVTCLFLSLFTNCSEKDDEIPVILTSLSVDKISFSVEATASSEQIAILSNKDWTAKSESSWLSISPTSGKADSKLSVELSISANPGTEARSATITITADDKSASVKVEQKGKVIIPGIDIADTKFKQYLLEAFDTDKDGQISTGEAEAVKVMNASGKGIESLSGIEFFVNLESLNCNNNLLTNLDISRNILLTSFSCDSNKIDSLGLSANTLLNVLSCGSNEMTKLDISNNEALTDLNCSSNDLAGLDISKNKSLKTLDCSKNELTALEISGNSELASLICSENNLSVLDVSKNPALKKLDSKKNESLEKIILAKDQTIPELSYDEGSTVLEYPPVEKKLVSIPDAKFKAYLVGLFDTDKDGEISEDEALGIKEVRCSDKGISSLTGISSFVNLEILDCSKNTLSAIDVSKNLKLREFDCSGNSALSAIDVSKNTALTKIYCYSCKLSSLNVEFNKNLIELNCSNNKTISSLDLLNNTALQRLFCQGNSLTSLDLRKNLQLKTLNCRDNSSLASVYLEENFVIESLFIDTPPTIIIYPNYVRFKDQNFHKYLVDNFDSDKDGNLSDKEISAIKEIDCSKLGISSLEGVNLIKNLTSLICSGNNLTSIDISSNTALITFECDSNKLSSIDVSKNVLLETLNCSNNMIKSLNLSSNINLKHLICNENSIGDLILSTNKKLETLLCQDNVLSVLLYLNNNSSLKTVNCKNNSRLRIIYLQTGTVVGSIQYDDTAELRYLGESEGGGGGDTETDISALIPDPKFKTFMLNLCDSDNDGLISETEAKTVTTISCAFQGISSLEGIENFPNLVSLNCNSNGLTSLSLSQNTKLNEVNCYSNSITSIDITGCVALTKLICGANEISSLNLSKNVNLNYLDCSNNNLSVLNVRNSPSIGSIYCGSNAGSVTIFMLSSQTPTISGTYTRQDPGAGVVFTDPVFEYYILNLTNYDSDKDGVITSTEAANVTKIECSGFGIKSLGGIESFTNLKELNCYDNNISGPLILTTNTKLTHLVCGKNNISSINVSSCLSLSVLTCENNNLTTLNLVANESLTMLTCIGNSYLNSVILHSSREGVTNIIKDGHTVVTY